MLALAQPPLAFANAVMTPSVQAAGTTSYAFACASGFFGPAATISRGSDGSWAWAGGVQPSCTAYSVACPTAGKYYSAPGSATSDITCTPCASGTFQSTAMLVSGGVKTACAPWSSACPTAGTFYAAVGSATSDITCTTCAPGTFQTTAMLVSAGLKTACPSSCTATACSSAGQQIAACTATTDRVCSACPLGTYRTIAATGYTTQGCTGCPTGIYTTATGSTSVGACTVCAPGYTGTVTSGGTTSATGCFSVQLGTDQRLCSANVILGSSLDYEVLAATDPLNTFGADVVVATKGVCDKLTRSSGSLRCAPSTLTFTDPLTGSTLYYASTNAAAAE